MAKEKRWSLSVPMDGFTLAEHVEIAREAERLGYTDAWSYEVDAFDCFTPLTVLAQSTNLRLGTAIANVFTRGPALLAQQAAALAELAPGRFELGIGSGSEPIVERWNGLRFRKPATRVRETVLFLRKALAGERVVFEGETFRVDGFRLRTPPKEPVPIHVAALREGMLRVAGEVADGAIINWLSVDDVRKSVGVVREAARAAGRDPEQIEILARLMVLVDPPTPAAEEGIRRHIAGYLTVPVYKKFHQWLGRSETLRAMWEAWDAGDRRAAVAAIPEAVVHELIVWGTAEERREHIRRYMEAGVDTAFLSLFTFEQDPEKKRENILRGMRELAPSAY